MGRADAQDPDEPFAPPGGIDKADYLRRRAEHIALLRGKEPGKRFDVSARVAALRLRQQQQQQPGPGPLISATVWSPFGPAPVPNGQVAGGATNIPISGRVTAIDVHPTNPNIAYVGTAQGGLFRTTDGGTTWTALMDTAQTLAIGAVTIDPLSPSTVFVGTGEGNGCLDCFFGVGIYRIINADTSPTVQGPFEARVNGTGTLNTSTSHAFLNTGINRIAVDPNNDNVIFVGNIFAVGGISGDFPPGPPNGAFEGLYFSSNAQAATPTFSRVSGVPGSGSGAVMDVVFEPGSSDNLLVALQDQTFPPTGNSGIYRSTNASTAAFGMPGTSPTFTKTLATGVVNSRLAINKVASVVTVLAGTGDSSGVLKKSTDGGATFPTTLATVNGFCGGQCFYDIVVAMDPGNASNIHLGGSADSGAARIYQRSTNGVSFTNSDTNLHADVHAITLAPSSPSTIYFGSDGGVFKSTDSGATWTSLNNAGLNTIQFMSAATHPLDRYFSIGGTQDNGTPWFKPDQTWTRADFGDGGFALIDQNAANNSTVTMYHTYSNQPTAMGYARVTSTIDAHDSGWTFFGCGFAGSTANGMTCSATATLFYAPMALGPGNPNTLYFGSDVLYRSSNSGVTMIKVSQEPIVSGAAISAIGIAPSNDNVRLVGLQNGGLFLTTTGSGTLTDANPLGTIPANYIARAVIDPNNVNTAYVTLSGFGLVAGAHVWKTTNLTTVSPPTWTASGIGIPDVPVDAFVIDPNDSTNLYAGTDIGVYRSTNSGVSWSAFGTGLPAVAVFGMSIHNLHRILKIATHGRGMWEIGLSGFTAQRLIEFSAARNSDGRILLQWRTGRHVGNLGYRVYREQNGQRILLNSQLIAGSALLASADGRSYSWMDRPLPAGEVALYWLEDVGLDGQSTWYGPALIRDAGVPRVSTLPPAVATLLSMVGRDQKQESPSRPVEVRASLPAIAQSAPPAGQTIARARGRRSPLAAQPAVKISIKREGWYRITGQELIAAGLDPAVDPRRLGLYVDGYEVPIRIRGEDDGQLDPADTVEFYGISLDAASTDTRVYWLVAGALPGQRISTATGSGQPGSASFLYTVERRDRTVYFSSLRNGDKENFFGAVIAGEPVDQVLTLRKLAPTPPGDATLEVALQGVTAGPHRVKVLLNGTEVGEVDFDDQSEGVVTLTVSQSRLREGDNVVRLVHQGGDGDVSLVDTIRLSYWHTYTAEDGVLRFTASGGRQVTIDGFPDGQVRVIDVTNPDAPIEVVGTVQTRGTGYAVSAAAPGDGARKLFAFGDATAQKPATLARNRPSNWRQASAGADLIIVGQRDLLPSVDLLRQLRQAQGYSVAVVDVEDVFDEFSFGHKTPQAIKDFFRFARTNWQKPPRFALLVGDASFDPKNYLGKGDYDLVPTRLLDTAAMETASDDWFADFRDTGLAEMAVGRLPARTPQEAYQMALKILAHEASSEPGEVLLVAGRNDGYDFDSANAQLKNLVSPDFAVEEISNGKTGAATAKGRLLAKLNTGPELVNYAGHGSVDLWGDDLLTSSDAATLTNGRNLPLVATMTCLNGYFVDPALDSLAESLLKASRGGAAAAWAPSGMTDAGDQMVMDEAFLRSLFQSSGAGTLGETIAEAKAAVNNIDIRRTWILFGDPTMKKLRKGKLLDAAGREIVLYQLAGCWGNPPADYLAILDSQRKEIEELKKQHTVIEIPCSASPAAP